jgi:hypothetical protein
MDMDGVDAIHQGDGLKPRTVDKILAWADFVRTDFTCQLLPSEMAHRDIFVLTDEVKILRSRVAELEVDIRRTKSAYDYVCWLTKQDSNAIYDKIVNGEG